MTTTATLTIGGLTLALLVLAANLYPWWTGKRQMKQLSSFGKGFGGAALAASCPGGILGWVHSHTGGIANSVGEKAGSVGTGASSAAGLNSGRLVGLSATGAVVVAVGVFLLVLSWKGSSAKEKKRIVGGAFVGSAFLLTAGIAGLLGWLPTALNSTGDQIVAAVQGAL